jgi:hypothetical protein
VGLGAQPLRRLAGFAQALRPCGRPMLRESEDMMTIQSAVEKNISKLEAQLQLWGAKLEEVVAKAKVAGAQAKVDSNKQLDELKAKLEVARAKLDEAKSAGGEKWENLKDGVEQVWKDIERAFNKVVH